MDDGWTGVNSGPSCEIGMVKTDMNKTLLVLRNEIVSTIGRKSFLFTAFGLPLIAVAIFLVVSLLQDTGSDASDPQGAAADQAELQVEGYVDQAGLIASIHPDVPEDILVEYPDEESASQALKAGAVAAYYVIPADYLVSGDLIYINPDYNFAQTETDQSWVMRRTIFANLLENDPERIARASHVMDVQVEALSAPEPQQDQDSPLTFYIPYATTLIIYMVILMSASLMMNSVSEEKKNRVMEVLLLSASPRQMLSGKIIGLGILGLLQAFIWVGTGYSLLRVSGRTFSLPSQFELPLSILGWAILFFLLGYAVYASLMAGLGALAPGTKEASQSVVVVIWPLFIPLFLMVSLIEDTHGAIATGLSLFPLTAPVAMMTRLVVGGVPVWQPVLAAGLMLVTIVFVVRSVSRLFHAQTLLSGQSLSVRRFVTTLLGR
jgi:ABC-2 type transport system permease protein